MILFLQNLLPDVSAILLFNLESIINLVARFIFNFFVTFIIIRFLYFAKTRRTDYFFTYLLFSTIIFLICYILESIKIELGFALGLFAIFGVIRYRTTGIPIREMTYLFVIIGISIINALFNSLSSIVEVLIANTFIVVLIWIHEKGYFVKNQIRKRILYENIELIKIQNRKALLADLEKRTGLTIDRVSVGKIDFLRDVAVVYIYYYEKSVSISFLDNEDMPDIRDDDMDD